MQGVFVASVFLVAAASATTINNHCYSYGHADLIAHDDCDRFIICDNGEAVVQKCPSDLLFNIKLLQCDWKKNVDCKDRNKPHHRADKREYDFEAVEGSGSEEESDESSGSAESDYNEGDSHDEIEWLPNGCPINPNIHWLLPHKIFCRKYYQCIHGVKVLRICPKNLHFKRLQQVCDKREDAGCRRIPFLTIPDDDDELNKEFLRMS